MRLAVIIMGCWAVETTWVAVDNVGYKKERNKKLQHMQN